MADIETLRVQTYSSNMEMLLAERGSPFSNYCRKANAAGSKAYRFLAQVAAATASRRNGPFEPIDNQAMTLDARWVNMPLPYNFNTVVDDIDLLQTNIEPRGAYVTSAVEALNRQKTDAFLAAFFGDAKTGETGSTTTSFASGNTIAVTDSLGAAVGLTLEKILAVKTLAKQKFCDFSSEMPIMGLNSKAYNDLEKLTEFKSRDFTNDPILNRGNQRSFSWNGIMFVESERITTNASGYYRLPFWLPSGMGEATWFDIKTDIRQLPNYKGKPWLVEAESCVEYTRLEENKCFEVLITA